jgi:hypothetical protein
MKVQKVITYDISSSSDEEAEGQNSNFQIGEESGSE